MSCNYNHPRRAFICANSRENMTMCKICAKLIIIKTPERHHWRCPGVFVVNFEQITFFFCFGFYIRFYVSLSVYNYLVLWNIILEMRNLCILWKTNLHSKSFFFKNNKNAKLMKVSFPILTSFLNNVFFNIFKLNFIQNKRCLPGSKNPQRMVPKSI